MSAPEYLRFANREQWRQWLVQNHATKEEFWLTLFKKKYRHMGLSLNQAIEEALCFGWIDSTLHTIDDKCYALRFSPRKKNSIWSISNINRVKKLIAEGRMTDAGLTKIKEAKENGEWDAAIQREQVDSIPEVLLQALNEKQGALEAYKALKNSRKKQFLYWLQSAKREETVNRRIQKIISEVMEKLNDVEVK
jgi:uncharacterized protein YdeI (YjbR/CyaY-like superfamily)